MDRPNLAGRAGRWSAGHWKTGFFGWLVCAALAMTVGSLVGHVQMLDVKIVVSCEIIVLVDLGMIIK